MRWSVLGVAACRIAVGVAPATALASTDEVPQPAELVLQCLTTSGTPDLRITLRNTGKQDINLVLGMTLANGRSYHASALFLDVRQRGSDMIEVFQATDAQPRVAGRMDPWILPLPVASEFSLARSLGDFAMKLDRLTMDRAPMNMRLRLVPRPEHHPPGSDMVGAGLVHVAPGDLQSAWIRVPEDCKRR